MHLVSSDALRFSAITGSSVPCSSARLAAGDALVAPPTFPNMGMYGNTQF